MEKRKRYGYRVRFEPREKVARDAKVVQFHGIKIGQTIYLRDIDGGIHFATEELLEKRLRMTAELEAGLLAKGEKDPGPLPRKRVAIVRKAPLGWALSLLVGKSWVPVGVVGAREGGREWLRELVEKEGQPWICWRHFRRKWKPLYNARLVAEASAPKSGPVLPTVKDDRHAVESPPGWYLSGFRLEVTEGGVLGRVVKLRRPVDGKKPAEPGEVSPAGKGVGLVMTGVASKAEEHLVRWGEPRRLVKVWRKGERVTPQVSCAKRKRFETFLQADAAKYGAEKQYGGKFEAHGCTHCGGFHIGKVRNGSSAP